MILLLLAAQVAPIESVPAPVAAPAPTRFSILEPIATEPCVRRGKDGKTSTNPDDIVVCGKPIPSQKLPYPGEVVPDGPVPVNPYLRGTGALDAETNTPCAARQKGCTTGIDIFGGATQMVRTIQRVIAPDSCCERPGEATNIFMLAGDMAKGVGKAFRKKPDKSNRIAIALDAPPPTGTILP
ncbi:hypothetical protein [Sphingomonas sp.]|uniref:hypothetical protein n=1 Tax=Sphingomonas sp. TaxID=28214 RepID=UPI003340440D